jgi:hypothetical protein
MAAARSDVLREFDEWVERVKCKGTRTYPFELNAPFVPFTAVKDYLTIKLAYMLLGAVFPHEEFVVDALTIRDRYPKVICFPLTLRRGHLISYFYNYEIQEDRLPVSSSYHSPSFDRYF